MDKEKKQKEEKDLDLEESWNLKRILIGLTLLVCLIFGGFYYYLNYFEKESENNPNPIKILGSYAENSDADNTPQEIQNLKKIEIPTQETVNETIIKLKEEITKLTPEDVASNSEQLQKIINDINSLQNKSKEPKDVICNLVCEDK